MKSKAVAAILALAIALAWLLSRHAPDSAVIASPQTELTELRSTPTSISEAPIAAKAKSTVVEAAAAKAEAAPAVAPILLRANNFEGFVSHCFQGEPCKLDEDPRKMLKDFRIAGHPQAIDQLLSFMRRELQDPVFAAKYKKKLKTMIDDFYPPQERQFQDAAFYDYAGEPEKSLELYKDLEKKSAADPSLRGAPKLNIANVLYTLKRMPEAKTYYEAARDDYASGRETSLTQVKPDAAVYRSTHC